MAAPRQSAEHPPPHNNARTHRHYNDLNQWCNVLRFYNQSRGHAVARIRVLIDTLSCRGQKSYGFKSFNKQIA